MYLEKRFNQKWTWDAETKIIFPGLSVVTLSFEHSYFGLFSSLSDSNGIRTNND